MIVLILCLLVTMFVFLTSRKRPSLMTSPYSPESADPVTRESRSGRETGQIRLSRQRWALTSTVGHTCRPATIGVSKALDMCS